MSQSNLSIANEAGASFRADSNGALQALVSSSSGTSAPGTTYADQFWYDSTNQVLKKRNQANSAWFVIGTRDETFVISRSSNTVLGLSDFGKTFIATSTFTQTLTAAATLGDGWSVYYRNDGAGVITLDPNASETIDGSTTLALNPGDSCRIACNGSSFKTQGSATGLPHIHAMELRLSLTTGVPVTTADVTAATSIRLVPYKGGHIDLFDGVSTWNTIDTAEVSVAVPATTSTPFDIWARNVAGVVTLDTTNWTNDTTRATALAYQNGMLVKSGDTTRRYLGTARTTGVSGQTEDSKVNRFLQNYYNRALRNTLTTFSADRTTASTTYVELNTEIRCNFVIGVSEDAVFASADGGMQNSATDTNGSAISFDSTTVGEPGLEHAAVPQATRPASLAISGLKIGLAVGFHFATLLGKVQSGTGNWDSTTAANNVKTYLHIGIWG